MLRGAQDHEWNEGDLRAGRALRRRVGGETKETRHGATAAETP